MTLQRFMGENGSGKGQGKGTSEEQKHTNEIVKFSSSAIRALTGTWVDFERDDGYMIQGLQESAGEKFGQYFVDPTKSFSIPKVYTRKTLISELTEEHNMEKPDAELIIDQLIIGGKINVPDGSLKLIKLSFAEEDLSPLFQLFKTRKK